MSFALRAFTKMRELGTCYVYAGGFTLLGVEDGEDPGLSRGLPISGVLANIYMVEFDEAMAGLADELGSMYMRYSDDFIFIAPTEEGVRRAIARVAALPATVPSVIVHPEKTKAFCLRGGVVTQLMIGEGAVVSRPSSRIDYLGFSFDGVNVRLRQRTIGRYYRRMYRRVKRVFGEGVRPSKRRVEELYVDFSDWGSDPSKNKRVRRKLGKDGGHGNFLTYAYMAQEAFPDDPVTDDVKRHKFKIWRRAQGVLGRDAS